MFHILSHKNTKNKSRWSRILIWARNLFLFFLLSSVLSVLIARFLPVRFTNLMLIRSCQQWSEDRPLKMDREWVPIDSISSHMIQSVIASEDNRFMTHWGFDFKAIGMAKKMNKKGGKVYGASTISQQVAKNVFLWPKRSWLRKGLEAYYTVLIETLWPKKRIMEVYLNIVELGDGIYGVEAASRYYYKHSSAKLTRKESAMLAATLPNPLVYNPQKNSKKILLKRDKISHLSKKMKQTPWGLHISE